MVPQIWSDWAMVADKLEKRPLFKNDNFQFIKCTGVAPEAFYIHVSMAQHIHTLMHMYTVAHIHYLIVIQFDHYTNQHCGLEKGSKSRNAVSDLTGRMLIESGCH